MPSVCGWGGEQPDGGTGLIVANRLGRIRRPVLDYQVAIVVLRFDGWPGSQVTLDARWRLLGKDGQELVLKRSTIKEPIAGEGYQALVQGMNQAIATLAQEIATEIGPRRESAGRR